MSKGVSKAQFAVGVLAEILSKIPIEMGYLVVGRKVGEKPQAHLLRGCRFSGADL